VSRGCTRESMVALIVQGGFSEAQAHGAIDEVKGIASPQRLPSAAPRPRPQPRTDGNTVTVEGHAVRIAFEVERPQVVVYEELLSADECSALIALADQRLARSTVVDDDSGGLKEHVDRTSAGGFFARGENELVAAVEARIAALLNWPVSHGEGLQVLRYAVGGEYKPHFDFFDADKPGGVAHMAEGGQRVGTLIMYLSDVDAGGATSFPKLGLHVRPRRGSAVYFENTDARGAVVPNSLHAGSPVVAGVKYIATKWLRERAYGAAEPGTTQSP
jgi:prolyl 4-hydroxylase